MVEHGLADCDLELAHSRGMFAYIEDLRVRIIMTTGQCLVEELANMEVAGRHDKS